MVKLQTKKRYIIISRDPLIYKFFAVCRPTYRPYYSFFCTWTRVWGGLRSFWI